MKLRCIQKKCEKGRQRSFALYFVIQHFFFSVFTRSWTRDNILQRQCNRSTQRKNESPLRISLKKCMFFNVEERSLLNFRSFCNTFLIYVFINSFTCIAPFLLNYMKIPPVPNFEYGLRGATKTLVECCQLLISHIVLTKVGIAGKY